MLQFTKDSFLRHDIFLLVLLDDVFLLQHLHGVDLLVAEAPHQQHFGVGALSDHR